MGQPNLPAIKQYAERQDVIDKFVSLPGGSDSFIQSVVNVCSGSVSLQKCTPQSVWSSALKSATLKLSVDPELGQAFLVPYKDTCKFQLGWRGMVQLAIRTGMYKKIHVTRIYQDEVESYDPIREEIVFKEGFNPQGERYSGGTCIGYYAYFQLHNGYEAGKFMLRQQTRAHAEKYSKAYQYDLSKGEKKSGWSTNFDEMSMKTGLMLLMKNFGYISTEIRTAVENEADGVELNPNMEIPQSQYQEPVQQQQPSQNPEPVQPQQPIQPQQPVQQQHQYSEPVHQQNHNAHIPHPSHSSNDPF